MFILTHDLFFIAQFLSLGVTLSMILIGNMTNKRILLLFLLINTKVITACGIMTMY